MSSRRWPAKGRDPLQEPAAALRKAGHQGRDTAGHAGMGGEKEAPFEILEIQKSGGVKGVYATE